MQEDTLFSGQPLLAQILDLIPRNQLRRLARQYASDRYYKKCRSYEHLLSMLYGIYSHCTSIREVETGLLACQGRLRHLGIDYSARRSTLSDANKKRDPRFFEAVFQLLYQRYAKTLPDSRSREGWLKRLYILDSTTISLFQAILKCAGRTPANGKRKGGVKAHTLIKADEDVPCLVRLTSGATHDAVMMKVLDLPAGAIVVFDKGYVDYTIFEQWSSEQVSYVSRLRESAVYEVLEERSVSEAEHEKGVESDRIVMLGHTKHKQVTRTKARVIVYWDKEHERSFHFVTNQMELSAYEIAEIYKRRWQIELLFKRLKQSFPLKYFLGDNENAIRIQIWCALVADLLLNVIRRQVKRPWAYSNLVSMVRVHLMTYIKMIAFFNNPEKALLQVQKQQAADQTLSLFAT